MDKEHMAIERIKLASEMSFRFYEKDGGWERIICRLGLRIWRIMRQMKKSYEITICQRAKTYRFSGSIKKAVQMLLKTDAGNIYIYPPDKYACAITYHSDIPRLLQENNIGYVEETETPYDEYNA